MNSSQPLLEGEHANEINEALKKLNVDLPNIKMIMPQKGRGESAYHISFKSAPPTNLKDELERAEQFTPKETRPGSVLIEYTAC